MPHQQTFYLPPKEVLSTKMKKHLAEINHAYRKSRNYPLYLESLRVLFQVTGSAIQPNHETNLFLGGFIEGEGSINVSIKKQKSYCGVNLTPEFSLTQHANGFLCLLLACYTFQTGIIEWKETSNATLTLKIGNTVESYPDLLQKVIPFYKKYVIPYGRTETKKRVETFEKLVTELTTHRNAVNNEKNYMIHTLLPMWSQLRKQIQRNTLFETLEEAQEYVRKNRSGTANLPEA